MSEKVRFYFFLNKTRIFVGVVFDEQHIYASFRSPLHSFSQLDNVQEDFIFQSKEEFVVASAVFKGIAFCIKLIL